MTDKTRRAANEHITSDHFAIAPPRVVRPPRTETMSQRTVDILLQSIFNYPKVRLAENKSVSPLAEDILTPRKRVQLPATHSIKQRQAGGELTVELLDLNSTHSIIPPYRSARSCPNLWSERVLRNLRHVNQKLTPNARICIRDRRSDVLHHVVQSKMTDETKQGRQRYSDIIEMRCVPNVQNVAGTILRCSPSPAFSLDLVERHR